MDRGSFRLSVSNVILLVFYQSESSVFEKTHISMFIVYLPRFIIMSLGKGSDFVEECVNLSENGDMLSMQVPNAIYSPLGWLIGS